MAEDTKIDPQSGDKAKIDSPMPSENAEQPEQSQESAQKTEGLPEDAKERTKKVVQDALSEAKTYKTQLQEERARREYFEQLFSQMQTKQPKPEEQPKFVDPLTGLPNEEEIAKVAKTSQEALKLAQETRERSEQYLRDQENKRLFAAHPELDKQSNPEGFNQELHNLTSSLLVDNMLHPENYQGKTLDPVDAAAKAKKMLGINIEQIKKQAANEAIEQLTPKEQASLDAVGSPSRRSNTDNLDDLLLRSRGNSEEARLARIERFNRIHNQE